MYTFVTIMLVFVMIVNVYLLRAYLIASKDLDNALEK